MKIYFRLQFPFNICLDCRTMMSVWSSLALDIVTLLPLTETGVLSACPSQNWDYSEFIIWTHSHLYSDIFPLSSLAVVTMQPRINSNIHPTTPPFSSMTDSNATSSRKKDLPDLYRTAGERACVRERREGVCTFLINKQSIFTDLASNLLPPFTFFFFTCFYFENDKPKRCHPC